MTVIEAILDSITARVRSGRLEELGQLAVDLESALQRHGMSVDRAALERLKSKAEVNARLLDAARRGVRAARKRIEDAQQVAHRLQTYDNAGKRSDITIAATTAGRF